MKLIDKLEQHLESKHGIKLIPLLGCLGISTAIGLVQYLYVLLIY